MSNSEQITKMGVGHNVPLRLGNLRRLLARGRAVCPAAPVAFGAVVAQLGFYLLSAVETWLVAIGVTAALLMLFRRTLLGRTKWSHVFEKLRGGLLLPFLVGGSLGVLAILLQHPRVEVIPEVERTLTARFLLEVVTQPRRPKPGGVRVEMRVRQQWSDEPSSSATESPHSWRGKRILCRAVDLPWREIAGLRRGDVVAARASIKVVELGGGPLSYNAGLIRRGITGSCSIEYAVRLAKNRASFFERTREELTHSIHEALGTGERAGLVLALVLGERDGLSEFTEKAFRRTGLSHVLVLSGYQVSLVFALLWGLFRGLTAFMNSVLSGVGFGGGEHAGSGWGCLLRWWPRLLALSFTMMFVLIVGVESSSLRAAVGLCALVVAQLTERDTSMWNLLVVTAFVLCLIWPGIFLDPSAQLTYAALVGIVLGSELRLPGESRMRSYLRVSFWATLLPLTVGLLWFGTFPVAGLVLNPLCAPLIALFGTVGGGLAMLLHIAGTDPAGIGLEFISSGLILLREGVVSLSATMPGWMHTPAPLVSALIFTVNSIVFWWAVRVLLVRQRRAWNVC